MTDNLKALTDYFKELLPQAMPIEETALRILLFIEPLIRAEEAEASADRCAEYLKMVRKEERERIKVQAINAKKLVAETYAAHKLLKPRDRQAKSWHDGYDNAIQDLINYLGSLKDGEK